jgi:CheY-like chemotaxis protein
VDGALQSAQELLRRCDEASQLAELESGNILPHSGDVDVHALLAASIDQLGDAAARRGIDMMLRIDTDVPAWLELDGGALETILSVVLDNAVTFTDDGQVAVVARTGGPSSNRILQIEMRDTGVGIPVDCLIDAFTPFALRNGCGNDEHDGLGIGLARAHGLATVMGGSMMIDSAPGEGTVVVLEVPLRPSLPKASAPTVVKPEPATAATRASDHHVLLVEDNEVNRMVTMRQLAKLGYHATAVQDGRAGIEAVLSGRYSVVLMDSRMPGMGGLEATRQIRAAEKTLASRTPIVALTASSSMDDRDACLVAGMDDYIAKPVDLATLSSVLRRWTQVHEDEFLPVLDRTAVAGLAAELDGDPLALARALEIFVDELPARRLRIVAAHRRGATSELQLAAGALRSTACSVGATVLARLCAGVEWAADNGVDQSAAVAGCGLPAKQRPTRSRATWPPCP